MDKYFQEKNKLFFEKIYFFKKKNSERLKKAPRVIEEIHIPRKNIGRVKGPKPFLLG